MPSVTYGDKIIAYSLHEDPNLAAHYITVEKNAGVILKGKPLPLDLTDKLILKKARWILDKLTILSSPETAKIVTGSRIPYLGRQYYTEVILSAEAQECSVTFNHSQFRIVLNPQLHNQESITEALENFHREKAMEKITPRVKRWSKTLNLPYAGLKFRKMEKRWGSCTGNNTIILNYDAVKLPFTLIDYLIVHELCHTVVKSHSKEFWAELTKHLPDWKKLDAKLAGMELQH